MMHGITKLQDYEMLYPSFPDLLGLGGGTTLTIITLIEVGCSALLIIGLLVRPASIILAIGMFTATFIAFPHKTFAQGELSFVYMGIYLALAISGGGRYAFDKLLRAKK